jgi:hypothetical protein
LTSEELETMMDAATREKIREFVLAGCEAAAPATSPATSPTVEEVVLPAEQVPVEPVIEGDAGGLQSGSAV